MTQPQDPRKQPLQDDEIALARVLRALPAGEPPASVDAAILRAATDAVSPGRRKPAGGLRWLPTWAIGTAAAAVLAVGIGVQLRPPLAPEPAAGSVNESVKPLPQARERLSVDLVEPEAAPAPPPASAPPERRQSARVAPPPPPPPPQPQAVQAPAAPPAPAVPAEPFPESSTPPPAEAVADLADAEEAATLDSVEVTGSRMRREATDQARRAHQESYARRAEAKAASDALTRQDMARESSAASANRSAPAASAAAPAPVAAAPAAGAPLGASEGDAEVAAAILPPVADDAGLAPDDWIERIRERRRQGDSAGARASLRLFQRAYPEAPVPSDLDRLR